MTVLERHRTLTALEISWGRALSKPGVRGFPDSPPALEAFTAARFTDLPPVVDASGTAGTAGLHFQASGGRLERVVEASRAATLAAAATFNGTDVSVVTGLPWDLASASVGAVLLAPPFDRGNARVRAELEAGARAVRAGGALFAALHKEGGAKRFTVALAELFETVEIRARSRGWRLVEARLPRASARSDSSVPWLEFEAAGLELVSMPGVHSAGKLDPGTGLLVEHVPWRDLRGRRVLDLGCGYGLLALLAARSGADVVAGDDDLAAVASCRRNAELLGLPVDVRHSDIDSDLKAAFDVILCNPPFHVGRGVRLEVPLAFLEAARTLLAPRGGELWLVANRSLPYERELAGWPGGYRTVADERGFKVLSARC